MSDPIEVVVRAGDCPCPDAVHTEERVYLEPVLTLPVASGAATAIRYADATASAQQAALINAYLPAAIRSWTFLEATVQKDGKRLVLPVPVTRENMERLLPWDKGGLEVAEQADGLYSEMLLRPLVARLSMLLPAGPTDDLTRPIPSSGSAHRKHSRRSSQNGSAGNKSAAPAR